MSSMIRIYKSGLHQGEEPLIQGNEKSGMINFSGCMLSCRFCYTPETSQRLEGTDLSAEQFLETALQLVDQGARNLNLITPSHVWDRIEPALARFKEVTGNQIPLVLKIGGGEPLRLVGRMLALADILVPDFKVWDPRIAKEHHLPENYGNQTLNGICLAIQKLPSVVNAETARLRKGVLIRHLLLPGAETDTMNILEKLSLISFTGPVNLMTRFIDPDRKQLISYPQASLDRILIKAKGLSLSIYINGKSLQSDSQNELMRKIQYGS